MIVGFMTIMKLSFSAEMEIWARAHQSMFSFRNSIVRLIIVLP